MEGNTKGCGKGNVPASDLRTYRRRRNTLRLVLHLCGREKIKPLSPIGIRPPDTVALSLSLLLRWVFTNGVLDSYSHSRVFEVILE